VGHVTRLYNDYVCLMKNVDFELMIELAYVVLLIFSSLPFVFVVL